MKYSLCFLIAFFMLKSGILICVGGFFVKSFCEIDIYL